MPEWQGGIKKKENPSMNGLKKNRREKINKNQVQTW